MHCGIGRGTIPIASLYVFFFIIRVPSNFPLPSSSALLNRLHTIDPNNARTGVDRCNPAYWYEKEMYASGCAKMDTCPFKNTVDPRVQCSSEFKARFPDKVQGKFRGPADWFHWINK